MARRAGKVAVFVIEDAASAARDISTRVSGITMNRSADEIDVTGLNVNYRDRIGGFTSWSLDIRGFYDDAAASLLGVDELLNSQLSKTITACFMPSGSAGIRYSGSIVLTAYNTETTPDGAVGFSATGAGVGAYSRA